METPLPLSKNQAVVLGFGWYQPEQWARLREISEDRDDLDETYEDWQANAQKQITHLEAAGHRVEKVPIDVEALLRWCRRRKRPVNGKARAEYAAQRLQRLRNHGDQKI